MAGFERTVLPPIRTNDRGSTPRKEADADFAAVDVKGKIVLAEGSAQIPAVLLWHFTDQHYHTDLDRIDRRHSVATRWVVAAMPSRSVISSTPGEIFT